MTAVGNAATKNIYGRTAVQLDRSEIALSARGHGDIISGRAGQASNMADQARGAAYDQAMVDLSVAHNRRG